MAECVLDVTFSRLQSISPSEQDRRCGFMIAKNGNCFKFYSDEQESVRTWIDMLKNICILGTFSEEYKTVDTLGRGSFAKVSLEF